MLLHTYLEPIFRRFIHDDPLIYLAATLYTLFSLKVGSDGPNSSPTRAPTRTLYERLDGLQLLDPRNLNFCGHLDVHTESELGPESDWK